MNVAFRNIAAGMADAEPRSWFGARPRGWSLWRWVKTLAVALLCALTWWGWMVAA